MVHMKKSMKRIMLLAVILAVTALSCIFLAACQVDNITGITVTPDQINVRIGEFEYDEYKVTTTYSSGKTEECDLTEEMIAPSDRLKFFKEGTYEIPVMHLNMTTTLSVNVRRNVFEGATFDDLDVVYTGEFYTVEVKNVPEGTTVVYPTTNRFRSAGEYQATAILRKDAYEIKEMKAKVKINKADYDLSKVVFTDKSEPYDGTQHILAAEGELPVGLFVDYTITREGGKEEKGNTAKNAGNYVVKATFTGDYNNFNVVEDKTATLTIERGTIDISDVKFENKTEVYDRTRHKLEIQGTLPTGVTVSYRNNEHVDAGEYKAIADFTVADTVNYAPIESKTATLTIEKAKYDMSSVHFNGIHTTYDGSEKKIAIEGTLPTGLTVSYADNGATDAGIYSVTAKFTTEDENYNNPDPMVATIIIDPAEAPMDQISFARMRFIVQNWSAGYTDDEDDEDDEEWYGPDDEDDWDDEDEEDDYYTQLKNYTPFKAAMNYRPTNLPVGLDIESVRYFKTEGWVEDLLVYNENDGREYKDEITEDGYYIVLVTFDGHGNYSDVGSITTQIRTNTVPYDGVSVSKLVVYDEDGIDPETGEGTQMFYDSSFSACIEVDKEVAFGENIKLYYCDCNVFYDYVEKGTAALVSDYNALIDEEKADRFTALTQKYVSYLDGRSDEAFSDLLSAAVVASKPADYYGETFPFDLDKTTLFGLDNDLFVSSGTKTIAEYREVFQKLFGAFDRSAETFASDLFTIRNTILDNAAGASMASPSLRCRYNGSIYTEDNGNEVFILPYRFMWTGSEEEDYMTKNVYLYVFIGKIGGERTVSVLVNDEEWMFDSINVGEDEERYITLYGRCIAIDSSGHKLHPMYYTVVTETGETRKQYVTNGNQISFFSPTDVNNVEEERTIYHFRSELPGSCAETAEGYSKDDYTVTTERSTVTFCDDYLLGSIAKHDGSDEYMRSRTRREDNAQMTEARIADFDNLAAYFFAFISNYEVSDVSVTNEWKIGVNNRLYGVYKDLFDQAKGMYDKANRNLSKGVEYAISDSVIIGMNRTFSLSLNGSGLSYNTDAYREMVMRLFGFEELSVFSAYSDILARALIRNDGRATAEFMSTRLIYDGAIYTDSGYFILPYVIKSSLTEKNVLTFVFVDESGNMFVWINSARSAFAATAFPADATEKAELTIYGRCMLFEDDGFIMLEDLEESVYEMVGRLKAYNPYTGEYEDTEPAIAVERIKNVTGTGDILVYTELRDTEGFEISFCGVYDPDYTYYKGFHTMLTIVDVMDVVDSNQRTKDREESPAEDIDENDFGEDDEDGEGDDSTEGND